MIKGINNQPYLDMEQHIDMDTFEKLQPEIMRGFAEARWFAKEGTWMKPGFEFKDMSYTLNWKPIYAAMEEFQSLPDDDPIKVEGMKIWPTDFKDYKQRNVITRYLKMAMEAYDPYIYYFLHEEGNWDDRPEEKKQTEESQFFPNTMKWLQGFKDNGIFESFGRVMFFHCEADGLPFEHRDLGAHNGTWPKEKYEDHNNEFIHIRPDTRNQFYIWDPDSKMKHGINTRAAFWNDQDWHGGNRVMCPTYGMRIDGTFTDAFREKLKLSGTY